MIESVLLQLLVMLSQRRYWWTYQRSSGQENFIAKPRKQLSQNQCWGNIRHDQGASESLSDELQRVGSVHVYGKVWSQEIVHHDILSGKCPKGHGTVHLHAGLDAHRHAGKQEKRTGSCEAFLYLIRDAHNGVPASLHFNV